MRAYYLNPRITPEGLKELDAISDNHVATCNDAYERIVAQMKWDDPPEVRQMQTQLLIFIVQSKMLLG